MRSDLVENYAGKNYLLIGDPEFDPMGDQRMETYALEVRNSGCIVMSVIYGIHESAQDEIVHSSSTFVPGVEISDDSESLEEGPVILSLKPMILRGSE